MFWINLIIFPTLHTGCITGKHLHQSSPQRTSPSLAGRGVTVLSSLLTYPSCRWFASMEAWIIWALHYMQIQACRTNTEQIIMSYNKHSCCKCHHPPSTINTFERSCWVRCMQHRLQLLKLKMKTPMQRPQVSANQGANNWVTTPNFDQVVGGWVSKFTRGCQSWAKMDPRLTSHPPTTWQH